MTRFDAFDVQTTSAAQHVPLFSAGLPPETCLAVDLEALDVPDRTSGKVVIRVLLSRSKQLPVAANVSVSMRPNVVRCAMLNDYDKKDLHNNFTVVESDAIGVPTVG